MRRVLFIFLVCFFSFLLFSSVAMAAPEDGHGNDAVEGSAVDVSGFSSDELEVDPFDHSSDPDYVFSFLRSDGSDFPGSDAQLTSVTLMSVVPVQPADDGSLKSILLSLIGDYDPIVLEYSYQSSQGYTSYLREVQIDYPWIAAAVLFVVVLWCVFKIGGKVIWNR